MIQLVLIILVFSSLNVCGQHYEAYKVRDDSEDLDRSSYSHLSKRNASASTSARKYQRSTRKTTQPFLPTIATSSSTTPSTTISTTGKAYRPYESVRSTSITPLASNTIRKTRRRPHISLRKPTGNTTAIRIGLQPRKRNETRLLDNANIEQIISEASNVVSSHLSDNSYLTNTASLETPSNYLPANSPDTSYLTSYGAKGSYFNTHAISEAAAAKVLFSTDLLSPKFNVDQTGFGYFKSASNSHSLIDSDEIPSVTKRKTTTSPSPIHFHLDTELAIADLPLQSSYASQNSQHFRRPPPGLYRDRGISVASQNQIQLYNDDVRAQHETRVIEQLANSPHPADKAKYFQYLKSKEDEKIEKLSLREQSQKRPSPPVVVRSKPVYYHKTIMLNNNGPPQHLHFVRKPVDRPISLGLSHYKTHLTDRSYSYPFI